MSFQAYLDTINTKTGKDAQALRAFGETKQWTRNGVWQPETKTAAVVATLKAELGLGHGHAMAVVALLKGMKKEGDT